MNYFMGIDVSTTGSKALIIDLSGNVIGVQSSPHNLSNPKPLWSEQDPDGMVGCNHQKHSKGAQV